MRILYSRELTQRVMKYYNQINKRMKEYFPQKFAQKTTEEVRPAKEPVQKCKVRSVEDLGGRKSVKLTKSQVVIAKKLGGATRGIRKIREGRSITL